MSYLLVEKCLTDGARDGGLGGGNGGVGHCCDAARGSCQGQLARGRVGKGGRRTLATLLREVGELLDLELALRASDVILPVRALGLARETGATKIRGRCRVAELAGAGSRRKEKWPRRELPQNVAGRGSVEMNALS